MMVLKKENGKSLLDRGPRGCSPMIVVPESYHKICGFSARCHGARAISSASLATAVF
jgi:hypothetical protein